MSQDFIGFEFPDADSDDQSTSSPSPTPPNVLPIQARPKTLWIDWDALNAIPIEEVGNAYGLTLDPQTNMHMLPGESKGKLSIDTGKNVFHHFATKVGGGAIQLVHLLRSSDTNSCALPSKDQRLEIAREIAERFGCLKDLGEFADRQKGMAAPLYLSPDVKDRIDIERFDLALRGERDAKGHVPALDAYHRYLKNCAKPEEVDTRVDRAARARVEAAKYLKAVELRWDQVSLAWAKACLCICPSAPRFGGDLNFEGWGKDEIKTAMERDGSNLYVLDMDEYPLVSLVSRLVRDMAKAGAPCRVMELSSIHDTDTERSKVHLSFLGSEKVKSYAAYSTNHKILSDLAKDIIDSWEDVPAEEKARLKLDDSMRDHGHLKRLAGTSKVGKDKAAIVFQVWETSSYIDFIALGETRGSVVEVGNTTYFYGRTVKKVVRTEEMPKMTAAEKKALTVAPQPVIEESTTIIARGIYPLRVELPLSEGDEGEASGATILCRFHKKDESVAYWRWPLGTSHNAHTRSSEISRWASRAMQIEGDLGRELASSLDLWGTHQKTLYSAVTHDGWQTVKGKRTYVSGSQIVGAGDGIVSQSASNRGYVGGTFQGQREAVAKHVTTPTQLFALGVSLSGMLLDYIGFANNYGFHIVGSSSSGKTTTARLCASVYGFPSSTPTRTEGGVEVSPTITGWNTTSNALENTAQSFRDAALVMDEIKSADRYVVANIIHTYASGAGKARMTKDSKARKIKYWQGVMVSTGEMSISQKLGDLYQGGESVRLIDIPVVPGDLTQSANQANSLRDALLTHYGHFSIRFAEHLLTLDHSKIQTRYDAILGEVRSSIGASPELQRIAEPVATSILALDLARDAGILTHEDKVWSQLRSQIVKAISSKIASTRSGANTPEERAHKRLKEIFETEPGRIPAFEDKVMGHTNVIAHRLPQGRFDAWKDWRSVSAYFTSTSLGAQEKAGGFLGDAGTTAAKYLDYLRSQGLLRESPTKTKKVCGVDGKWIGIILDGEDRGDEEGEESIGFEGIAPIELLESLMGELPVKTSTPTQSPTSSELAKAKQELEFKDNEIASLRAALLAAKSQVPVAPAPKVEIPSLEDIQAEWGIPEDLEVIIRDGEEISEIFHVGHTEEGLIVAASEGGFALGGSSITHRDGVFYHEGIPLTLEALGEGGWVRLTPTPTPALPKISGFARKG